MKHLFLFVAVFVSTSLLQSQSSFDSLFLKSNTQIQFESDQSSLDSLSATILDRFVIDTLLFDSLHIKIAAHTDNVGNEQYNLKLSQERAKSVANYLQAKLPKNYSLELKHFGEVKPKNANQTEDDKSINRRVEISMYEVRRLQWLSGKIVEDENKKPIENALVRLHSKEHQDSTYTGVDGKFKISSPVDKGVGIDVIAVGQMPKLIMKKISPQVASKPLIIKTEKIEIGKKFSLRLLYFVGNKAILLPKSRKALPTLKEFMIKNKGTCVRIEGHVNLPNEKDVKRVTQTFQLSSARAKTLFDFLHEEAGVDSSRMHFLGFGNWRMLFPKAFDAAQQQQNRRVEIIIASCEETKHAVNDTVSTKFKFWTEFRPKKIVN